MIEVTSDEALLRLGCGAPWSHPLCGANADNCECARSLQSSDVAVPPVNRKIYRANRAAFTVLELLIVVFVILVLTSLILPVVQAAQESGRTSACSSNLHQLHTAFTLYAADHDDLPPPYQNVIGARYCEEGSPVDVAIPERGQKLVESLSSYTRNADIWFCPTDTFARTDSVIGSIRHRFTSYRANTFLGQPLVLGAARTMTQLTALFGSDGAMLTDALWPFDPVTPRDTIQVRPPYSHNGSFNRVYFDGHIKRLPWESNIGDP